MAAQADQVDKSVDIFTSRLETYRAQIDERIASYAHGLEAQTSEVFGQYPALVTKTFTDSLVRGGKRIRGAVLMNVYYMLGGEDSDMILDAALALEMLNTYILMMDDVQDRSDIRRGGKTAHVVLREYHEKNHLKGDAMHFGISMTMDAYFTGCHAALEILTNLKASPEIVLRALRNVNHCYITTVHGQTLDIMNQVVDSVSLDDISNVLEWKTAHYTFVNPMQLGAILAGGDDEVLECLYDYAIATGRAFQIVDDILGIFGEDTSTGKSVFDDIKEGKKTVLIIKALESARADDAQFLEQCLGKQDLTVAAFKRCQKIISDSGALRSAQKLAESSVSEAIEVLSNVPDSWHSDQVDFLKGLARYVLSRRS